MTEKKIVKDVVKTFSYYDAGYDYFFVGAIVVDSTNECGFSAVEFREGDYDVEYVDASPEMIAKWNDFQKSQSDAFKLWNDKFREIKLSEVCPVCSNDKMYFVHNENTKRLLQIYRNDAPAIFCPKCKSNVIYRQSILGTYSVSIYRNFKPVASLNGNMRANCVERYLESPKVHLDNLAQFNKDLEQIKKEVSN